MRLVASFMPAMSNIQVSFFNKLNQLFKNKNRAISASAPLALQSPVEMFISIFTDKSEDSLPPIWTGDRDPSEGLRNCDGHYAETARCARRL